MNTAADSKTRRLVHPASWWREPMMWLVVGGPAVVVVAGVMTAVIAIKGADPVLDKEAFEKELKAATAHLDDEAKKNALLQLQPAHQARNHAASPVAPKAP
ncbi:MAG: FixH family protein [Hydrogenophaga sp.]